MLVLHPNSTCDVCLEGYHGTKEPLVIACGHIFCHRCLQSLTRPCCPLCRLEFKPGDVRRMHVDKTALPPATPLFTSADADALTSHARRLQAGITRVVLEGAPITDVRDLINQVRNWLSTQPRDEHTDLRAAYLLLYRYTDIQAKIAEEKRRVVDVEQICSDLKAQLEKEQERFNATLEEEREIAATKYEELELRSFEEREVLLANERSLEADKERLRKECDEWRTKCDEVSTECGRLTDELEKFKRNPSRPSEPRYFYLHDQSGTKPEPVAILKDEGWDHNTLKVQIVGKDNIFHLSPVPHTQPIPDLPSSMMTFLPLTDDIEDPVDDDKSHTGSNVSATSASRSIPIEPPRSDSHSFYSHRARSNSSLLTRPDPDAMSVSVPRSLLDVHMASCSTSPSGHGSRPAEFVSSSVGRMPENALGLRADPSRVSPSTVDHELKEQQERRERLAQLRDVLQDPMPGTSVKSSPRKGSVSEVDRARPTGPIVMSSTRTPSPVSSTSHSYSASSMEYNQVPYRMGPTPISSASIAAAERERERTRASSVNAQNAPSAPVPTSSTTPSHAAPSMVSSTTLSHVTTMRDREMSAPVYPVYGPHPQMPAQLQSRPSQTRRQSTDNQGSLSKGKASSLGIPQPGPYPSGLTRSMQRATMQDATRVSS